MGKAWMTGWKPQSVIGFMGLSAVFALNRSGLDLWASAQFYDWVSSSFPLRDEYLYSEVLHSTLKTLSVVAWLLLFVVCMGMYASSRVGLQWKVLKVPRLQSGLKFILASSLLCAGLVAWLKSLSAHSCPWDLAAFGGTSGFFYLGASIPDFTLNLGPGKCFPSGHASVGWMWVGLLFITSSSRGLTIFKWLVIALSVLVSVTQVARGAHFPSHVLMTAVICWVSSALVYHAIPWAFKSESQLS